MTREVGVAFSDVMVRALLAGHKSQTRRLADTLRVGDRIYIREAWRPVWHPIHGGREHVERRADLSREPWPVDVSGKFALVRARHGGSWRPARFMFKALARPERWEVVARSAEHLQDIDRQQAWMEGSWQREWENERCHPTLAGQVATGHMGFDYRAIFARAWDEIHDARKHPEHAWAANPIVYAYTLRKVAP